MKVRFDAFVLDTDARQLRRDDTPVHLSPKAFDLLATLVERRPAVVDKAELRERLWPNVHVVDTSLSNLVTEIRAAVQDRRSEASRDDRTLMAPVVRTVHGVGYAFAGEAVELATRPATADVPSAVPCWLVWKDRPLPLSPGDNIVGRDTTCAVWIEADGVSRRHACIRVPRGDGLLTPVTIEDFNSTNGTHVRGRRAAGEVRLEHGDRIRLGDATLVFRVRAADAPTKRVRR